MGGVISGLTCAKTRVLAHCCLDKKPALCMSHRSLRCFAQTKTCSLSGWHRAKTRPFRKAIGQTWTSMVRCRGGEGGVIKGPLIMRPTCQCGYHNVLLFALCSSAGVGRGLGDRGGRGVLTSMRMRLASSVSVVAPCREWFCGHKYRRFRCSYQEPGQLQI